MLVSSCDSRMPLYVLFLQGTIFALLSTFQLKVGIVAQILFWNDVDIWIFFLALWCKKFTYYNGVFNRSNQISNFSKNWWMRRNKPEFCQLRGLIFSNFCYWRSKIATISTILSSICLYKPLAPKGDGNKKYRKE